MIASVRELEHELMIAALDTARIGLCVFDQNGHIVMVNQEFAAKLHLNPEQLVNQTATALSTYELVVNNLRELVDVNGDEMATEGRLQCQDGQLNLLLFQARSMTTADQRCYRVVTVLDITNFGITRDRYIELRRQLDALNSSVVLVDARQERMPILYVNKRFEEMTGYSTADAIGKNCRFLQGEQKDQAGSKKLRVAIASKQSCHTVLQNFKKDGTSFFNEVFISPIFDKNGSLAMYVGIQQEVNSRLAPYSSANQ